MKTGARYFLLDLVQHAPGLHGMPTVAFFVFCGLVFGLISVWAWENAGDPRRMATTPVAALRLSGADFLQGRAAFLPPAFALAAALMFLFAPHYAWYIAWLFPFFCLMPSLPMATYLMAFFYGYTTWLADPGPKMFLLNKRIYGATLLALAVHMALKAWAPYRVNFLAHQRSLPIDSEMFLEPTR